MPEKRYKRGDGKRCLRCWRNRLKHGNKNKKKKIKVVKREGFYWKNDNPKYVRVVGGKIMTNNEYRKSEFRRTDYVIRNPHWVRITPSKIQIKEEQDDIYGDIEDNNDKDTPQYWKYKWKLDRLQKKINKQLRK